MSARDRPAPGSRLLESAVTSQAIALAGVVVASLVAGRALVLSDWYAFKAGSVFTIIMLLAVGNLGTSHPFDRFGAANQVTTLRAAIAALVTGLIGEAGFSDTARCAAAASLAVTALDGLDGWLARRLQMASRFGARFDMEIDALLIMALAVLAWRYEKAGSWILVAGLLRYLFVAAGWRFSWMRTPLPPNSRRRTLCLLQLVGLSVVLLPTVRPPQSTQLAAVLVASLLYSFLLDTFWLWRHGE